MPERSVGQQVSGTTRGSLTPLQKLRPARRLRMEPPNRSITYEPVPLSISDRACSTSSAVAPMSLAERAWVSSSLRWRRSRW